jgi:hypothetical protein
MVSKGFTPVHVRDMDLDKWNAHRGECVAYGHAGMGEGCRVDQDEGHTGFASLMNPVDHDPFVVGLETVDRYPMLAGTAPEHVVNVSQAGAAINIRLALSQAIQVRAI